MSVAVRLKERIVVFFGLAFFGVMFLCFRSFDCIAHIYVASNNMKTISLVASVYSSSKLQFLIVQLRSNLSNGAILIYANILVYPEICSKEDAFLLYGLTSAFLMWIVVNVASAYSVYYNVTILPLIFSSMQCFFYLVAVLSIGRWVQIVQRNVGRFQLDKLTIEEYTFLQYLVPTLLYAPSVTLWNFIKRDMNWQTRSVETLIFYISANCLVAAIIIGECMYENIS